MLEILAINLVLCSFRYFCNSFLSFLFFQENDILFLETSAMTGENVEDAFVKVCEFLFF